jgi:large subunit ribosomal protein L25
MKSVPLTVFPRTLAKRTGVKKLRAKNRIPAVIYGRHNAPECLEMNLLDYQKAFHHGATESVLLDLEVKESTRPKRLALIQDVQRHALSGKVLHVDFHEVLETEKVSVTVPAESVGEAIGVKNGGVLEHILFKLKVRALPRDLPEAIVVDVSALEIGKSIHIGEIVPPPGVEILGEKKIVVISVAAPISEAEEAAAEAAATTAPSEPEVLMEKKEEGEAGAEAAPKGEKGAEKKGEKAAPEKAAPAAEKKAEKKK